MIKKFNNLISFKNLLITILLISIFFLISFNSKVVATRGCCSHHGGVCGCDTNVGMQVCCDGTYSPSCTCAYLPRDYIPPKPIPTFPPINARWSFIPNLNETWDIKMELLDDKPTKYSAVISKIKGLDPGPLVDFYDNNFYFKNITPGKWYVNVKKEVDGVWTNVVYWTIDVPEWQSPTPTLSLKNGSENNLSESNDTNELNNSESNSSSWLPLIIPTGMGILLVRYIVKKVKKDG